MVPVAVYMPSQWRTATPDGQLQSAVTVGLQRDVRPALAATDAIQCVTGGKAVSGVKLATHLQLTPKSTVCGVITSAPPYN